MKNFTLIFSAILFSALTANAQKYWEQANLKSGFDTGKSYKIAILPVKSSNSEISGDNEFLISTYNKINMELSSCARVDLVNRDNVLKAISTYCFSGNIDISCYNNITSNTGATLLLLCELSRDLMTIKKKEVSTIMAYIQIFDATNDFSPIYSGKARMINPISKEAEMEMAVSKALKTFIDKMK